MNNSSRIDEYDTGDYDSSYCFDGGCGIVDRSVSEMNDLYNE
ncbi:MAG: hypothetical protein Q4A56_01780 [Porphyromonadaceae bacterium]|nr:hypothetical protein [Porphyromonadaceae bacterium]